MYHYDVQTALEELKEDALLPHPVRLRDMILRTKLGAEEARELNREFQSYLSHFGETQKIARTILEQLRSEEHTSELQSHLNLVCRLLLEKKKKKSKSRTNVK